MKFFTYLFILTTCSLPLVLEGWWDAGHMVIAQIAYDNLHPEVREKADHYLAAVSDPFPNHADFISASIWADDIHNDGLKALIKWHSSRTPYDPEGILSQEEKDRLLAKLEGHDIVWAIEECMRTLSKPEASDWSKGFMLRMLIHIVGDAHNPLHCIALYNSVFPFPEGDHGGLHFKITHENYRNLLDMWNGCLVLDYRPEHPMTVEDRKYIRELTDTLAAQFPRDTLSPWLEEKSANVWVQESYEFGVNVAYQGILPGEKPSEKYIEAGKEVGFFQLTLAGYRLADLLNETFAIPE